MRCVHLTGRGKRTREHTLSEDTGTSVETRGRSLLPATGELSVRYFTAFFSKEEAVPAGITGQALSCLMPPVKLALACLCITSAEPT